MNQVVLTRCASAEAFAHRRSADCASNSPISRGRNSIVALDGIDLEIGDDEFLTVLGPSGCGKTTLLNIVAGFDHASDGTCASTARQSSSPARTAA